MKLSLLQRPKLRKLLLFLFDAFCFFALNAIYFFVLYNTFSTEFLWGALILFGGTFLMRLLMKVYHSLCRYTDVRMYLNIVFADAVGGLLAMGIATLAGVFYSLNYFLLIAACNALACLGSRFLYRILYRSRSRGLDTPSDKIPVAIIGAGSVGVMLAEELLYQERLPYRPLFFIDIDPQKVGSRVVGLPVYDQSPEVLELIRSQDIRELFVAMIEPKPEDMEKIYHFFGATKCKLRTYDVSMQGAAKGTNLSRGKLRDFSIDDLLFRKPLDVQNTEAQDFFKDKTILVTGGGGSIGSELCRQIAKCAPKKLIVLDIYENNAYDIQQEILRRYGNDYPLEVEIASVRDRERLEDVFTHYRPQLVFHAAAHKHVPLMEHSACEAIKNNILGTYNVADMAEKYGAEKFILISTDKAVNPTNIMGASKRMCERVIQCRTDSKTLFVAVRFGNVLGSNGSVIPLFRKQIAEGGPVTITDKRIIRYFMTIPEAASLVMQAGAMAKDGELFVLDMGKPVHIYSLAENMIRLSGLKPHVDIEIREVGLRPGEKLYEELLIKTEELDTTENQMIFIEKDTPLSREEVDEKIALLCRAIEESRGGLSSAKIKAAMKQAVPEFCDPEEINSRAEKSEEMKMVKE